MQKDLSKKEGFKSLSVIAIAMGYIRGLQIAKPLN
jgi:hypothetical protein